MHLAHRADSDRNLRNLTETLLQRLALFEICSARLMDSHCYDDRQEFLDAEFRVKFKVKFKVKVASQPLDVESMEQPMKEMAALLFPDVELKEAVAV